MPENEYFCWSFELFSWVSDFLSFDALEFFEGRTKKPALKYDRRGSRLTPQKIPGKKIQTRSRKKLK